LHLRNQIPASKAISETFTPWRGVSLLYHLFVVQVLEEVIEVLLLFLKQALQLADAKLG
jgi:hypothetical protein